MNAIILLYISSSSFTSLILFFKKSDIFIIQSSLPSILLLKPQTLKLLYIILFVIKFSSYYTSQIQLIISSLLIFVIVAFLVMQYLIYFSLICVLKGLLIEISNGWSILVHSGGNMEKYLKETVKLSIISSLICLLTLSIINKALPNNGSLLIINSIYQV